MRKAAAICFDKLFGAVSSVTIYLGLCYMYEIGMYIPNYI